MRLKVITKADIILGVVLLVLGLGSPFLLAKKDVDQKVQLTMDGEVLGSYDLDVDKIVVVTESGVKEITETELNELLSEKTVSQNGLKEEVHISYKNEEVLNIVEIAEGKASVVFASCSGNDCVKMGTIDSQGEVIACLPHKLLITIESDDQSEGPDVVL